MLTNADKREQRPAALAAWRGRRRWLAALGFVLATSPVAGAALYQAQSSESPATGNAQVIAQGVVNVPEEDLVWVVTTGTAAPPASATAEPAVDGFVVVTDGTVLLENADSGAQVRLAAGEAALTTAGNDDIRAAAGATAASYLQLGLLPAADVAEIDAPLFASEAFSGTGSNHDLDLVKDVMAAADATVIGAGEAPTLIAVLGGAVDVTTATGDVVTLLVDQAATLSGELTVTAGADGAVVVAAVLGTPVPRLSTGEAAAQAAATPAAVTPVAAAGTPTAGDDSTDEATIETATDDAAATDEPVTTEEAVVADDTAAPDPTALDSDGDGLTDATEAELNTDSAAIDTDGDGLTDGDEVLVYGTQPLATDTDGDGFLDGDEVAQGTDPLTLDVVESAPGVDVGVEGDSDADGLPNALEFELGTDAFSLDTDADGLLDGDEYYVFQTGTLNPDTDGDGVLDGDEINNGTDPNDPNSF